MVLLSCLGGTGAGDSLDLIQEPIPVEINLEDGVDQGNGCRKDADGLRGYAEACQDFPVRQNDRINVLHKFALLPIILTYSVTTITPSPRIRRVTVFIQF